MEFFSPNQYFRICICLGEAVVLYLVACDLAAVTAAVLVIETCYAWLLALEVWAVVSGF